MVTRDESINKIKNMARNILEIPIDDFLQSHTMNYMRKYLEKAKSEELTSLICSAYNIAELIDNHIFEEYSTEELNEIKLTAVNLDSNIEHMKKFTEFNSKDGYKLTDKLFEKIKSNYNKLEKQLQNNLVEKINSDDDANINKSKKHNQNEIQDTYSESDREHVSKEIKKRIDEQLKTPIDELLSSDAIKAFLKHVEDKSKETHFSSDGVLEILKKSHTILSIISLSSLSFFSHSTLESIIENTHELINLLLEIKEFKSQSEYLKNPPDVQQAAIKLIIQTGDVLGVITREIDPYITYFMNESRENFEKLNDDTNSILKTLVERVKTIDTLTMEFKEATSAVGSTFLTRVYSNQSKKFERESNQWLCATSVLVGIAVIFACALLMLGSSQTELPLLFAESSLRIFILGVLITATLWCGRNYRTVRHQAVINIERATIIKTLRAFAESSDDKKVKDLVLTEAVRSVFAPSPTGFVDHSLSRDTHGAISMINSPNSDKSDG